MTVFGKCAATCPACDFVAEPWKSVDIAGLMIEKALDFGSGYRNPELIPLDAYSSHCCMATNDLTAASASYRSLGLSGSWSSRFRITDDGKVYLFTGSKITGGFCVTRKGLLEPSKLGHILTETPELLNYVSEQGQFIKYKGRSYCWVNISDDGRIILSKGMMDFLNIAPGMELLSIRSSDIAFTMGAKGPLLDKAQNYKGEIPVF